MCAHSQYQPDTSRILVDRIQPVDFPDRLKRGVDATVLKNGRLAIDGYDKMFSKVADSDAVETGQRVRCTFENGDAVAIKLEELEQLEYERKAKPYLDAREKRQQQREQKAEATAFWANYELPFEYAVKIKGRRSGLSRGSWGDGRAADTVEHLYVRETFTDGRLERDADVFLCTNDNAHIEFDGGITRRGPDGESYVPSVTCSTCLERMERWRVDE